MFVCLHVVGMLLKQMNIALLAILHALHALTLSEVYFTV